VFFFDELGEGSNRVQVSQIKILDFDVLIQRSCLYVQGGFFRFFGIAAGHYDVRASRSQIKTLERAEQNIK
jgi:hypothetical protein